MKLRFFFSFLIFLLCDTLSKNKERKIFFLSVQEFLNRILVFICRLKHLHWKYELPTSIWWFWLANCLFSCGTQRYLEFSLISLGDCSGSHPVPPLANPLAGLHHAHVFLLKPLPGIYLPVVANKTNYYTFTPPREKSAIYRKQPLVIFCYCASLLIILSACNYSAAKWTQFA